MPKHEVIESLVDKGSGDRYEKKSIFDGTKERCGALIKGGYLNKEPFSSNFPEGKSDDNKDEE